MRWLERVFDADLNARALRVFELAFSSPTWLPRIALAGVPLFSRFLVYFLAASSPKLFPLFVLYAFLASLPILKTLARFLCVIKLLVRGVVGAVIDHLAPSLWMPIPEADDVFTGLSPGTAAAPLRI